VTARGRNNEGEGKGRDRERERRRVREGLTSAQIGRGDQQWIPAVLHADPTACLPHGKDGSDAVAPARAGELRRARRLW